MLKSGFVSIIGKPNVGKSTILNYLVGEKIAIISERPETTRNKIMGIVTEKDYQIVFVDTPGIHKPRHLLGKEMVRQAETALNDVDLILLVIDARDGFSEEDLRIIELLQEAQKVVLLINKVDLVQKNLLLPLIEEAAKKGIFQEIIPISATKGDNMPSLRQRVINYLPEGKPYFPSEQLTDKSENFLVGECIREKILQLTWQEVPQSVAVLVEEMQERQTNQGLIYIRANIYVEKQSQKKIMVGKKGQMLKNIGQAARQDMEKFLGKKVYLELWVKVWENWRKDPLALRQLGYIP